MKLKIADILSPGEEAATAAAIREVERSTLQVPFGICFRGGTKQKHGLRTETFTATLLHYFRLLRGKRGRSRLLLVERGPPVCSIQLSIDVGTAWERRVVHSVWAGSVVTNIMSRPTSRRRTAIHLREWRSMLTARNEVNTSVGSLACLYPMRGTDQQRSQATVQALRQAGHDRSQRQVCFASLCRRGIVGSHLSLDIQEVGFIPTRVRSQSYVHWLPILRCSCKH